MTRTATAFPKLLNKAFGLPKIGNSLLFFFSEQQNFLKRKNKSYFLHILVLDMQTLPRPEDIIQDIFAVFFKFSKSFGPVGIILCQLKTKSALQVCL